MEKRFDERKKGGGEREREKASFLFSFYSLFVGQAAVENGGDRK